MENINLKTLAKELNVSISTVSKALRDSYDIGSATKERIVAKAKELGYSPNPYASYMRHQKSRTIALVIPDVSNTFFQQVIDGAEAIAREKDYHILIYITHEDSKKEAEILQLLRNGRVDGIIMSMASSTKDYQPLNEVVENNIPIVFFDRICHQVETVKVTTDDFASGFTATEHLIQNGCKDIAFLSIGENLSIDNKRMQGYMEALNKYDIPFKKTRIIRCNGDEKNNHKLIKRLLNSPNRPDGIFSSIESYAMVTYHICKELGIDIPKQLKIVSFSNLRNADLLQPALTTITQPATEMGKTAASLLFRHLEKKRFELENDNIIIKSKLIVRQSSVKK